MVQVSSFLNLRQGSTLAAQLAGCCLKTKWSFAKDADHMLLMQLSAQQRVAVCKAACKARPLSFVLQHLPAILQPAIAHACAAAAGAGQGLALQLDASADDDTGHLLHPAAARKLIVQLPLLSGLAAVSLRDQHLGSDLTAAAIGTLASAPLTRLVLAGNDAGIDAMSALTQQLPLWRKLCHLDVADNGALSSLPATALLAALAEHSALTCLWLGADVECSESVQAQLARHTQLAALHPGHAGFNASECSQLFAAMQHMQLTRVDLSAINPLEQPAELVAGCTQLVTLQWHHSVFVADFFHGLATAAFSSLQELSMELDELDAARALAASSSRQGWHGLASLQHFTCLRLRGLVQLATHDEESGRAFEALCAGVAALSQLLQLHLTEIAYISEEASTALTEACQGLASLQALTLPVNCETAALPKLTQLTSLAVIAADAETYVAGGDSFMWLPAAIAPLTKLVSFELSSCAHDSGISSILTTSAVSAAQALMQCKRLRVRGMTVSSSAAQACARHRWARLEFNECDLALEAVQALRSVSAFDLVLSSCEMWLEHAGDTEVVKAICDVVLRGQVSSVSLQGTALSMQCFERLLQTAHSNGNRRRIGGACNLILPSSGQARDGHADRRLQVVHQFNANSAGCSCELR